MIAHSVRIRALLPGILAAGLLPFTAFGQLTVDAGYDLFQTTAGTTFAGVDFMGVPIGNYNFGGSIGVKNLGSTDTLIQRTSVASVGSIGNSTSVGLAMQDLQLESTAPVSFMGGPTLNYFITLQSLHGGPASGGSIDITFNAGGSGTFSSSLDVFFDVRAGSLTGPIVYSSDLVLSGSGNPWSNVPPSGTVLAQGVNYQLNGSNTQNDFYPGAFIEMHPTGAQHSVQPAETPEPWQYGLLTSVGLVGFAIFRSRR